MSLNTSILTIVLFICSHFAVAQKPYHPNKSYSYNVVWEHIPSGRSFQDLIVLKTKRGRINRGQRRIVWIHYPTPCIDSVIVDSIQSLFCGDTCEAGCVKNMHQLGLSYIEAKTGVIEKKGECWIHPPRIAYYRLFELSPFPWIKWNTSAYQTTLLLGGTWGIFSYTKITSDYHVEKITEQIYCINARSKCLKGDTEATFIFNKEKGFVSMDYMFFDVYRVSINLM